MGYHLFLQSNMDDVTAAMRKTEDHWNKIYGTKAPTEVSWFTPRLERSLGFIEQCGLGPRARIIDVGAGACTLADDLVDRGYDDLTILDVSHRALERARERLGERAEQISWLVDDVTTVELPRARFDIWHDRAVFHFLTDADARRRYVRNVLHAVRPGGHVIVATFGLQGPQKCSGLDVVRYDPDGLHGEFGAPFVKVDSAIDLHRTPWGSEQEFIYCYCRKTNGRVS